MVLPRRMPAELPFALIARLEISGLAMMLGGREVDLVACPMCAAVIVDDDEGANRALHEKFHADVIDAVKTLIDFKADAPQ